MPLLGPLWVLQLDKCGCPKHRSLAGYVLRTPKNVLATGVLCLYRYAIVNNKPHSISWQWWL